MYIAASKVAVYITLSNARQSIKVDPNTLRLVGTKVSCRGTTCQTAMHPNNESANTILKADSQPNV